MQAYNYKFFVETLGCKLNIYESEAIAGDLVNHGWIEVKNVAQAEVIFINTCTVTAKADAKCRNLIRKTRKASPNAIIVVGGCLVTAYPEMMKAMPEIDILLDNKNKSNVIDAVIEFEQKKSALVFDCGCDCRFNYSMQNLSGHSRAFIKVQDGCTNFCAYCKIPYARGTCISRPVDDILNEVETLHKIGYMEFVITGVNIGMYKVDSGNFTMLLDVLTKTFPECKFRVSSIEPMYVDDDFLAVFARPNVCSHLHIPLQSGSDKILQLMGRRYDCAEYEQIIQKARNAKPNLFLSTDLIVGFPSEDEQAWNEILAFVKKINYTYIHVFGFSPREGTKAYNFKNKTPERIRDQRVSIIQQIANENTILYAKSNEGKITTVIAEQDKGDYFTGKTDNYLDIRIYSDNKIQQKNLYTVKLFYNEQNILCGKII